jgi:hypothetical protein
MINNLYKSPINCSAFLVKQRSSLNQFTMTPKVVFLLADYGHDPTGI